MARRLALAVLLSSLIVASPAAQETPHAAADRARDKIDSIIATGEEPRGPRAKPVQTDLTEVEVNAYLQVHGPEVLPKGIAEPEIRLGDDGRIRARAIVDLDDVRKSRPRPWNDPLAYVVGSVEVVASGRIAAADGIGRAQLESATVGGLTVPKTVVQELLRYYTKRPDRPDGFDLDQSFVLPANIRGIVVRRGAATVAQ